MITDFRSMRITVMGLGRFGGGAGVTRWFAAQGARVLVTDLQPPEKLAESLADIADAVDRAAIQLRLGEHRLDDFTDCDLVIANPAVPKPWTNLYLCAAQAAGVTVTTEIRLLTERLPRERTIGITGSAGKSTTSAMVHHILSRALPGGARSHFGGNIGGSLLNQLDQIQPNDWIVLELSSAMLHWLGEGVGEAKTDLRKNAPSIPGWSPHIAVITNIAPNHIDWHDSFEHYRESKLNISRYQQSQDGDASITIDSIEPTGQSIVLKIPGEHNQLNARMAIEAASRAAGIDRAKAAAALADFPGLPHRLQLVAERDGLRFYNDSKSTTPEATLLAVAAFDNPKTVHLIAGGYDKGIALTPIADAASRIAGLYTIGTTGQALAAAAARGHAQYCRTLECAIETALARMRPGDVLLLSPGCASWDQFINYEQRGETFTRLVQNLAGTKSSAAQRASGIA